MEYQPVSVRFVAPIVYMRKEENPNIRQYRGRLKEHTSCKEDLVKEGATNESLRGKKGHRRG